MTNAQLVLQKIQSTLCHEGTTYKGNSGTYMFIEGKTTEEGTINGVVKKLDERKKTIIKIFKVKSQTPIIDEGVQPEVEQQPESIAV